jgi:methylmalonyl-CoA mutase N-terminal domain/subunit
MSTVAEAEARRARRRAIVGGRHAIVGTTRYRKEAEA